MARGRSQEREQFWRALIGRQSASGLNISQFCQEAGVSPNSFFVWRRRLRAPDASDRGHRTSARSTRREGHSPAGRSLVPVRLVADPPGARASKTGTIEVEWPNGLVLRVPMDCDGRVARDLVMALAPLLVGDGATC